MTSAKSVDENLYQYCTTRQLELLKAINKHGSIRAASRALGLNFTAVHQAVTRVEFKAALQGYSPKHDLKHPVAPGQKLRGASTYYDKDGAVRGQWVKSSADEDAREEIIRNAFAALAEDVPRVAPTEFVGHAQAELCNLYTMTDCHMGMLAWHKEGGSDWDIAIAERVLSGCFEHLVRTSPAASVGVVAQLGDFLHSDGLLPVTPTGGNVLDQDGRFSKIVQTSIRVLRRMVGFALERHERVIVLMAEGNHDMASSIWLRAMFKALYENEPRVAVIDSETPYYVYRHGEVMLAWHHGHLKKLASLPQLFAAKFPKIWGDTTKRYCHVGHRHHTDEKEHDGMTVHQHPTLAAPDAYASRHGWLAERQATSITYHRDFGQVARNTVTPEMLVAVQKAP